jgi:hypothetical protein
LPQPRREKLVPQEHSLAPGWVFLPASGLLVSGVVDLTWHVPGLHPLMEVFLVLTLALQNKQVLRWLGLLLSARSPYRKGAHP